MYNNGQYNKVTENSFKHSIMNLPKSNLLVVGYVTPETKDLSNTGNVVLKDEIPSLRRAVKHIRQKGIDIIIALGHSGYEKDLEIAKRVSTEVDI